MMPATVPRYRIVMVAHSRLLGGIERHVVTLSAALAEAGHRVAYAGPTDGWLGTAMREAGHDCLNLPMRGMYDLPSVWRLRRFARDWGADLLHGHAQRGTRYAAWAARGGLPALGTAHSTNAWKWFRPGLPIVAVSAAVRDFLRRKGFAAADLHLVHLGVPDIGPVPPPPDPGPTRPLVLGMLARIEKVKGHDIALRALASVQGQTPVRLMIVGPDTTDWAAQLKAQTRALGLEPMVDFQGQRSDLAAVFAAVDVMLAPSRREALSLSLIEAAAAGRPSIGARIGGIPEVIEDGQTGLLVPPEDPAALAAAILSLAGDPGRRRQMGNAARALYESRFTPAAMVRGVEACYADAIDRAARGPEQDRGAGRK